MILGLATRDKNVPLKTRKAAEGLYVVLDAYEGRYEYFESDDSSSSDALGSSDQPDPLREKADLPSTKLAEE